MLGLRFCARAFSSCGKRGPLFIAVRGPLIIVVLLRSTGSRRAGSAVVAHGASCSTACGIFPDQGSNPCPLHWQADSQPLRHQGSPVLEFLNVTLQILGRARVKPIPAQCSFPQTLRSQGRPSLPQVCVWLPCPLYVTLIHMHVLSASTQMLLKRNPI